MSITNYYITQGTGDGNTELTSFDKALLASGISNYNLVRISSILPADCKENKSISLCEGSILHTAYAVHMSHEEGKRIAAAIGVAIPEDNSKIGVIMECSGCSSQNDAEKQVRKMLQEAMTNRGYSIKEIKISACETTVPAKHYATAFAAISIW